MSSARNHAAELNALIEGLCKAAIEMSDEEALAGENRDALLEEGRAMLQQAREAAQRDRLARARAQTRADDADDIDIPVDNVPMSEVRRVLAEAMNDPAFTMAARQLSEMSDSDLRQRFQELLYLRAKAAKRGESGEA